jgi:hypothetical protein
VINLITPDAKRDIFYARKNTRLLQILLRSYILLATLIIVIGFGYFWINRTATSLDSQAASARVAIATQNLDQVQQQAESISNSLKLINQVLSKQILFSKLFRQMGAIMPTGSALSQISVEKIEGGISFSADARDATTASQVQVNLSSPDAKLFQSVDIINLDCSADSATDSAYPCSISLRAQFAKDSGFYFINSKQGTAQ